MEKGVSLKILICVLLWRATLVYSSSCGCQFQTREFETYYTETVHNDCKMCFSFQYTYFVEQNWTARICVRTLSPAPTPLLVTAKQSVSAISFAVPLTLKGSSSQFPSVCRTLCPVSHHDNTVFMNGTEQKIVLDFWAKSHIQFEFIVHVQENFVIGTDDPITLNLTTSEPAVLQYSVPSHLSSVRIEANSDTPECMILSVEDIQCPFHDTHETVQSGGYRQTHTKKSAITVKRESIYSDFYIVLLLNDHDGDCKDVAETEGNSTLVRFKEVTVAVYPLHETWYPFLLVPFVIIIFFAIVLCCLHSDPKSMFNSSWVHYGLVTTAEESYRKNYFVMSDMEEKKPWSWKSYGYYWNLMVIAVFYALPAIQLVYISQAYMHSSGNLDACYYNFRCAHEVVVGSWVISDFNHVFSNIGYVILGFTFIIIVSYREKKDPKSAKNMRKSLTTDQTVPLQPVSTERKRSHVITCYNCLGNHHLKNCPEDRDEDRITENCRKIKKNSRDGPGDSTAVLIPETKTGIPPYYGMHYTMGLALVMEGVMSATYHICPKKANFQFDTTFMYVISMLCIMELYYARHQAIAPKAHSLWMILAVSVFIPFLGLFGEWLFWTPYIIWVVIVVIMAAVYVNSSGKIEFGCEESNCLCCLKIEQLEKSYKYSKLRTWCMVLGLLSHVGSMVALGVMHIDYNTIVLTFYILNVIWYSIYYIGMKISLLTPDVNLRNFKESISWASITYFILFCLSLVPAMYFYISNHAEWSQTPAESRERNAYCLGGFNYYDNHDLWHFLSSFSIFFLYMFLFTVDDKIKQKLMSQIVVF